LAKGKDVGDNAQIFAPPALGAKNLYLCSVEGHLLSVSQEDGKVEFMYSFGQPMAFQPALADGAMYAGTTNGLLVCLKTGDKDADGWVAWGGNAQHNKKE
jgi:outer membrane protein assembly factor BamB